MNDDDAEKYLKNLINKTLGDKWRKIDNYIHNIVKTKKQKKILTLK